MLIFLLITLFSSIKNLLLNKEYDFSILLKFKSQYLLKSSSISIFNISYGSYPIINKIDIALFPFKNLTNKDEKVEKEYYYKIFRKYQNTVKAAPTPWFSIK